MILATLNRTLISRALAIVMAEHVLRWLPPGTHDWNKFITPNELTAIVHSAHHQTAASPDSPPAANSRPQTLPLAVTDITGMTYNPLSLRPKWQFSQTDMSVNYMLTAIKQAEPAAENTSATR